MTPSKTRHNHLSFLGHLLLMLILLFVISPVGTAQSTDRCGGDRSTFLQDLITRSIDRYLTEQIEGDLFSGTVVVDSGGEVIFRKGYGLSNREFAVEVKPEHRFMMGSCTKAFTATAIMICKERGLFGDLKTELMCDYLEPEITCQDAWRAITLYDLLTMSSGLPDVSEYNEGIATMVTFSTRELIEFTGTMPMHAEPGTAYEYNNTNYLILGYILERVTGSSYEAFLKEEIFRPFGMDETGAYKQDEIVPLMASGYRLEGNSLDTTLLKADYYAVSYAIATGNLYTTIDDFHRWSRILVDPEIISPASLEEMLTPRDDVGTAGFGYAYGWITVERYGQPCIAYAGAINGFNSAILHFRESDITVLVLRNRKPLREQDDVLRSIALDIAGIIFTGAVPE